MRNKPAASAARQPRGIVKINGTPMPWLDWDVENNTFYAADTFRVRLSLSSLPAAYSALWWSNQTSISVDILAGFPADAESYSSSDLDSLIYGKVDDMTFDPVSRVIELIGRDLTADLIDAKTTEKWQNLTASQIATQLATRHGMTPVVTATKTKAGKYYEIDHARLADERSEWDLLTYLAHEEGYAVYVKGQELHFEPRPAESQDPYVLQWDEPNDQDGAFHFNGQTLSFTRNLALASGITVTVRSWNAKNKKAFNVTYPTSKARGTAPGKSNAKTQNYYFTIPGLTPEQALQKAQAKHREISRHEVKMAATMPADNILGVTDVIRVQGTGTAFDQIFYPEAIRREMSAAGYTMFINAKNVSPENVVIG